MWIVAGVALLWMGVHASGLLVVAGVGCVVNGLGLLVVRPRVGCRTCKRLGCLRCGGNGWKRRFGARSVHRVIRSRIYREGKL